MSSGSKVRSNSKAHCILVNYQCKKKKNVYLISTMHETLKVLIKRSLLSSNFTMQKRCELIFFRAKQYTTHDAGVRPSAVWSNILDIAPLNSWIIRRKTSRNEMDMDSYILNLCKGLQSKCN